MVQRRKIVVLRTPIDTNGTPQGGNYSFVSVGKYKHFVVHVIVGNLAGDAALTLKQAKNVGGNESKELEFDTIYRVQTNAGAPEDQDKAVKHDVASNSYTILAASHDNSHFMIEMKPDQLDVNGGFDCIRPHLADPGAAGLVTIFVELLEPRYSGQEDLVEIMPSALDQT
jgi:hypothetical protein